MSYAPTTDFLALLRQTSGGVRTARTPGLDYVVAALARAGLFQLSVGQTAPTANQPTTAWLQPSSPSWVAEGTVFLWNAAVGAYQIATPALWGALLLGAASAKVFQAVTTAADNVSAGTTLLAITRDAPAATVLTLPLVSSRNGAAIQLVDWSTNVANHAITLNAVAGATIMRQPSWALFSTENQLAGVTLFPSIDLNGWVIAP